MSDLFTTTQFRIADAVAPGESADYSKAMKPEAMTTKAMKVAGHHKGSGFRLKFRSEEEFGTVLTLAELDEKLDQRQNHMPFGELLVVWCISDDFKFWIRCVKQKAKIIDGVGNNDIDKIHTALWLRDPDLESMGICNYRAIGGSSSFSEHCPWTKNNSKPSPGANAEDVHHDNFAKQKAHANWLVKQGELWKRTNGKEGLPVGRVISDRRIWDPVQGWHAYTGEDPHTSHFHYEGRDDHTGQTPGRNC